MTEKPNAESILSFAAERAQEEWDKNEQPYMLADLSPDLARNGINYKSVLGGQRLKAFVVSSPKHVKVIVHPTQKAKIGLIPPDEEFEFTTEPPSAATQAKSASTFGGKGRRSHRRHIVSNFLQLLSELDDDAVAQVQLPTHILTKLMRD